jgi:hypothetical protein
MEGTEKTELPPARLIDFSTAEWADVLLVCQERGITPRELIRHAVLEDLAR